MESGFRFATSLSICSKSQIECENAKISYLIINVIFSYQ